MPATHALIELLGEVALLLWGIHMARSGVLRAFGGGLRQFLGRALGNRLSAALAGAGVTVALQSSTATALMATSFVGGGVIGLLPALAIVLGANVGTALVCYAFAFDMTLVYPALLLGGLIIFRSSERARPRNVGRAVFGLGLVLLALHLIVDTVAPAMVGPGARTLLELLTSEPLPVLVASALLTLAMHSSVATVLIVATLAQAGLIDARAAFGMVLGANLGSAINPLLAARNGDRAALRLPLGNLANRIVGCLVALPLVGTAAGWDGLGPGALVLDAHLAFNLAMAILFLPFLGLFARLLRWLLPDRADPDDPARPLYLDPAAFASPPVALANASREILRLADLIETMLKGSRDLLRRDDAGLATSLRRSDDTVDRLHGSIEVYLAGLGQQGLDGPERDRLHDAFNAALNLEHAGDIIDKGLLAQSLRRIRRRQRLDAGELAGAEAMHDHLLRQLRLAVAVFMGCDINAALSLVEAKELFREVAQAAADGQLARLEAGEQPGETAALHLDLVRDLKRIEAHLAAIAHPLLERNGLLRRSRLVATSGN